jgi:hypothetical protein
MNVDWMHGVLNATGLKHDGRKRLIGAHVKEEVREDLYMQAGLQVPTAVGNYNQQHATSNKQDGMRADHYLSTQLAGSLCRKCPLSVHYNQT